ncbi:MAG: hypothetical protein SFU99_14540 [Saprospiraceae bacterium]|nr:hypothetical protein [Saprospiraceae bacterium]
MKNAFFFFVLVLLGMTACKSKPTDEDIAKELCACLEPMIKMYKEMGSQTPGQDEAAMMESIAELERVAGESQACSDQLNQKYGDLSQKQAEMEAAMNKVCPDVIQFLNENQ